MTRVYVIFNDTSAVLPFFYASMIFSRLEVRFPFFTNDVPAYTTCCVFRVLACAEVFSDIFSCRMKDF